MQKLHHMCENFRIWQNLLVTASRIVLHQIVEEDLLVLKFPTLAKCDLLFCWFFYLSSFFLVSIILKCWHRTKFSMTLQLLQRLLRPLTTHQLERNTISLHLYLPASPFFLVEQSGCWINLKTAQFLMLDIDINIFLEDSALPRASKPSTLN